MLAVAGLLTLSCASAFAQNAVNTATVTAPAGITDPTPANNTATDSDTIVAPQLTLTKTHTGNFTVGTNGVYTLTLSNTGTAPTTGTITVVDTLPTGLTFVSATGTGWTCSAAGQVVTCTHSAALAAGASAPAITLTVAVGAAAAPSVTNTARASGGGDATCPATGATQARCTPSDPTTVNTPANVTVVKTGPATVVAGASYSYTLTLSNSGQTATGTNVIVQDQLPVGVVATAVTGAACGTLPSAAGALLTCTIPGPIAAGGTAVVTLTVTAPATADSITNYAATATSGSGNPATPPGPGCTSNATTSCSSAPTTIVAPQLTLTKTANPSPFTVGVAANYTLTLTNTGTTATTAVSTITDTIPTGLTIGTLPAGCTAVGQVVTCTVAAGQATGAGAAVSFVIPVTPQASLGGTTVVNTARASGGGDTTCPPTGATQARCNPTINTPVTGTASLNLNKTASVADTNGNTVTGDAGDTITYAFSATNAGTVTLAPVTVTDPLLPGLVCSIPSLAPGATASCAATGNTYVITAADVTAGSRANTATATGNAPGTIPDPTATDTETVPTAATPAPAITLDKTAVSGNPYDSVGDVIGYRYLVTNTGNVTINALVVTDNRIATVTCPVTTLAPGASTTCTANYTVTQADLDAGTVVNIAIATGTPTSGTLTPVTDTETVSATATPAIAVTKTATLTTDNGTPGVGNAGDVITYAVIVRNTGDVTLTGLTVTDRFEGGAPTTLTCTPTTLAPGAVATCASYTHTITTAEANAGGTLDNAVTASAQASSSGQTVTVSASTTASVALQADPTTLRIVKTAAPRDVNIGDLVRYTLQIENTGTVDVVDGSIVDTPPAGFTYVDNSLTVADANNAGRLVGTNPIRVDQIDIVAGGRATITYLLRVGAGVRPGVHSNSVYMQDGGATVSNIATADVQLVADPMLGESLLLGTVYDDRDGDGWQDTSGLGGVRVQGGFAPDAYVANTTSIDRGNGSVPQADASAPLLHGIDLGDIAGRQSDADPLAAHTVVVSQTLNALSFSEDFMLTSKQGVTVRMDTAGNTRIERSGDAAKGLSAADPTVERRVSQVENGYRVDYVIGNAGVDERGIPGVRIASVEGLLIETDQYGRYHLAGVAGGPWERGRNFILKVDPATLPPGSTFTTDNPLVRRITPGIPVRFDFGVKLPPGLIEGGKQDIEMELGAVLFNAESAEIRKEYMPVIDKMAEQVRSHDGGEVVIAANGESQALAYERAKAVQAALLKLLTPEEAAGLTISLRTDLADPGSTLLSLGRLPNSMSPVLGTVLFDTDQATIKPQFRAVIDKVAADIDNLGGGVIGVVGYADKRGSDAYNVALGLRRAKAVYTAIAAQLSPAARSRLRVEISDNPTAPIGSNESRGQ